MILMYVGLSMGKPYKKYVCKKAWAELRCPNTRMLKVSFGRLKAHRTLETEEQKTEDHEKERLATLKILKRGYENLILR